MFMCAKYSPWFMLCNERLTMLCTVTDNARSRLRSVGSGTPQASSNRPLKLYTSMPSPSHDPPYSGKYICIL